jgi:serine/threonine protein kinase
MHLDIKPQNVLLDSQLQVKLLDFGLSAAFKPERAFIILHSKGRGTRPYTAPELVRMSISSPTLKAGIQICLLEMMLHFVTAYQSRARCSIFRWSASYDLGLNLKGGAYKPDAVQLAGSAGAVSPAADIYSFGCCLAAVCAQSRCTGTSSGDPPDIFGFLKKGVNRNTDLSAYAPQELHSLLKVCSKFTTEVCTNKFYCKLLSQDQHLS